MRRLKLEDIMALTPCLDWTRARVHEAMRGRSSVTASDILDAEHVPAQDRIWLLLKGKFFKRGVLILIAAAFAEHVLPIYERVYPDDQRLAQAIRSARLYVLDGIQSCDNAAAVASNAAIAADQASDNADYVDDVDDVAASAAAYVAAASAYTIATATRSTSYVVNAARAAQNAAAAAATAAAIAIATDAESGERHYQLSVIKQYLDAQQEEAK